MPPGRRGCRRRDARAAAPCLRRIALPRWAVAALLWTVLAAGCSDLDRGDRVSPSRTDGWSQRVLTGVRMDQAFDAAVLTMRQSFTHVEPRPAEGVVRGLPTEYTQKGGTGRIRDAVGARNRMRRSGSLVILETETGCVAKCAVDVQRLDTADHRSFLIREYDHNYDDRPGRTPIDRDAGVTADQNQVWTDMPRDRALERQILDGLSGRLAEPPRGPADEPEPAAPGGTDSGP